MLKLLLLSSIYSAGIYYLIFNSNIHWTIYSSQSNQARYFIWSNSMIWEKETFYNPFTKWKSEKASDFPKTTKFVRDKARSQS